MPTVFLMQDNVILLQLESLKESLVFHDLSYVSKYNQDIFFSFLACKTFGMTEKFITFQLYLFIKGLMLVALYGPLLFLQDLIPLLQHIESIYYPFY